MSRASGRLGSNDPRSLGRGSGPDVRYEFPLQMKDGKVSLVLSAVSPFKVDGARGLDFNVGDEFEVTRGSPYSLHARHDETLKVTSKGLRAVPPDLSGVATKAKVEEDLATKADQADLDATNADVSNKPDRSEFPARSGRGFDLAADYVGTVPAALVNDAITDYEARIAALEAAQPIKAILTLDGSGASVHTVGGAIRNNFIMGSYEVLAGTPLGPISFQVTGDDEVTVTSVAGDTSTVRIQTDR